jgi:nicotinamide phosphoribosyltransferase
MIYGDSITLERQKQILGKLEAKGFSASNLVFGIGSYTYEYVTRDTFGFAMKATWGCVNGQVKDIFKNPKTDSGFKKSAKGLLKVYSENGVLKLKDQCTEIEENQGLLETVFCDGKIVKEISLSEIRNRINSHL